MQPSEELLKAVSELSEKSGYQFQISPTPVPTTNLFVVHANDHPFRSEYTVPFGALGFRAPFNFPDAAPEDSFFIAPSEIKLIETDATRDSGDIHRAGRVDNYVAGSSLGNIPVLIFSWHLWDRVPWNRRKNTLFDHYAHCVRRFDQPEHD